MSKEKKLSAKEQAFVDEYLIDMNATQAAIRAGYAKSTADKQASLWIGKNRDACPKNKRHIWDAVNQAKQERSERTKVDADWLLKRLADEADADVADLYDEGGALKPIQQWPEVWRKGLVAGVDVKQEFEFVNGEKVPDGVTVKVRLSDRIKRLELIGKHIDVQAFNEKVTVESSGLIDRLMRGRKTK